MAWTKKRNPALPAEPAFHHPRRCMNCGHLDSPDSERGIDEQHIPGVGCLVPGGTKYLENENGEGYLACNCEEHVPAPQEEGATK